MVSKVFPYFSKIFIFSLIFCLTSCTQWTAFSSLCLWCQRFPRFLFNSWRKYTLCVYASTHNTYTFKICVMVIRTHEKSPLGNGFQNHTHLMAWVFKLVKQKNNLSSSDICCWRNPMKNTLFSSSRFTKSLKSHDPFLLWIFAPQKKNFDLVVL